MARLVQATTDALSEQEQDPRSSAQRDAAGNARRLLSQHGPALVRGYPMALLEICAEPAARTIGPLHAYSSPSEASANAGFSPGASTAGSPKGFGELTLLGEEEVQAQVEMSRAQQQAVHATDAVLAELDALMSAAQGLDYVQPERNPLRPYSYLRALQQVVSETGVPLPVRESWMLLLCRLLGGELTGIYQQAAKALRAAGIAPVGYGRGGGSAGAGARSRRPAGQGTEPWISQYGASGHSAFLASDYDREPWNAQAEEAMLTVSMLRQMLAGDSDFYAAGSASSFGGHLQERSHPQKGRIYRPGTSLAAVEALEDMAALEQLVTSLSQDSDMRTVAGSAPHSRTSSTHAQGASMYGVPPGAPARAAKIVARMVETMAEEGRLLAPVQRAVQNLESSVQQLVRHDARFFSNSQHPARRLLDEITQRSLAFSSVKSPGFSSFMRLVDEAVGYLSSLTITDAQPFDIVLSALQAAWETQEQRLHSTHQQSLSASLPVPTPAPAVVPPQTRYALQPEPEYTAQAQEMPQDAGESGQEEPPQPLPADAVPGAAAADFSAPEAPRAAETMASSAAAPEPAVPAFDDVHWVLGVWVEMHSTGRALRTQLTWVSPQQTLFLFTAADGSTQSMTRRVRDKLASTGALRLATAKPHGPSSPPTKPIRR